MEIDGARTLVAGATGVLGSALAAALRQEGARVAVAGRSERIADDPQAFHFDALDLDRCAAVVDAAADALGGLVVDGIRTGRRELRYDLRAGEFTSR